jgi:hypothetical protein
MATARKAPGVYTTIIDQSFTQPAVSRFRVGLIGVAQKGPFNTATAVRTLKEFGLLFGDPLVTEYDDDGNPVGRGFFMADAVTMLSDYTDGMTVVRVGNEYQDTQLPGAASGSAGSYAFGSAAASQLDPSLSPSSELYVRLTEEGKATTANARVINVAGTVVTLDTSNPALQDTYVAADVAFSYYEQAANKAESVINAYTYGATGTDVFDNPLTSAGTIVGAKNAYQFTVQTVTGDVVVGGVYKIKETNKFTTCEVRIKSIVNNTVYLEPTDVTRVGYQALPLQDNYSTGTLYKVTGNTPFLYLEAASEGEWANGTGPTQGLYVKVRPGSKPGTKKFEVYEDDGLVETIDNLSSDASSEDYYTAKINEESSYIVVKHVNDVTDFHAANTASPWDTNLQTQNLAYNPPSMPDGSMNSGGTTGGQFTTGYNGPNPQDEDFIGSVDVNDNATGLKLFDDVDNIVLDILAAPMSGIEMSIRQEMRRIAKKINALAIVDIPAGLTGRQAIDWSNGQGAYTTDGFIDDSNIANYWNWFYIADPLVVGTTKLVPPTIGTLRAMAWTSNSFKPWYAAAGEIRGVLPEAVGLQFPKVPIELRDAFNGEGTSINPIVLLRGRIMLYGERTLQRTESKLTAVHNVMLVNIVVNGLAAVARRFVFDPNDAELLVQLRFAMSEYLDRIRNERGLEDYNLVCDESNNTATTRNNREVICDLSIIPVDVAERIYINATVRESGAQLNSVT